MKLTLKQIMDSKDALEWLGSCGLRPGLALEIQRNIRLLNPEFVAYAEKLKPLGEEFGEISEDGKTYKINPEHQETVNDQVEEIGKIEIELSLQVIDFRKLEAEEGFKIPAVFLMALEWMFKFPEPEVEKQLRKKHPSKAK